MKNCIRFTMLILFSAAAFFLIYKLIANYIEKNDVRIPLFSELRPVSLSNCTVKRFGTPNDGGYLMCENLFGEAQSVYSYGIEGRDEWGCDVSTKYHVPVHQYDCFDTRRPSCPEGQFFFNEECLGDVYAKNENRVFDSLTNQIQKNSDSGKKLVVKMDVEGAEWDSLGSTSDEVLNNIEQLVIEFHGVDNPKYINVIKKLKSIFYVAHIHDNNFECILFSSPFMSGAYEVLFVNKRIGVLDETGSKPRLPHPLDALNNIDHEDCQSTW